MTLQIFARNQNVLQEITFFSQGMANYFQERVNVYKKSQIFCERLRIFREMTNIVKHLQCCTIYHNCFVIDFTFYVGWQMLCDLTNAL